MAGLMERGSVGPFFDVDGLRPLKRDGYQTFNKLAPLEHLWVVASGGDGCAP